MTRRLVLALLACAIAVAAAVRLSAQHFAPDVVATISGHVVDGVTGQALSGVAVFLQPAQRSKKSPCGISGFSDGQFRCEVMTAGEFYLSATKRGYVEAVFGARELSDTRRELIRVLDGERTTNLTVSL